MTQDTEARSRQASQTAPVVEDLSEAINQAVGRQADDVVRSVRVFGDCYRCNWWAEVRWAEVNRCRQLRLGLG